MTRPFLIVGTPRSRTAWLASFLSYGGRTCLHEPSLRFRSPECLDRFLDDDRAAASDSMMTFLAHKARHIRRDCVIVCVRRPLAEVHHSFARIGLRLAPWFLEMMDRRAEIVDEDLADLSVQFPDLEEESVCKDIFRKCLEVDFDREWWLGLKDRNIQSDIRTTLALLYERESCLSRVFRPHYDA